VSPRILVLDGFAGDGLALLRAEAGWVIDEAPPLKEPELIERIGSYEALIVRSQSKVTAPVLAAGRSLKVVGRAGTGVDNIDLKEATRRGIVVMNAPAGNSVAAAEHAFGLMLALARSIPAANASVREGKWERSRFTGVELEGKVLGICGLGRIGREVARRASAFRMKILAFDPYVSAEGAADTGAEMVPLETLLAASDFLTLHLPLSPETRHLLSRESLARVKKGVRIVNAARGELLDESALLEALDSGAVAGAALDVFEKEPPTNSALLTHERVVATPHLGASTKEAQTRVGLEIAGKIRDYLKTGEIRDAVNVPAIPPAQQAALAPYVLLAERLGSFLAQITPGAVREIEIRYAGEAAQLDTRPMTMATVKGALARILDIPVGFVNALVLARERKVKVTDTKGSDDGQYTSLVEVRLVSESGEHRAAGTVLAGREPRVVAVDGITVEAAPEGLYLFITNRDVPGVVGEIGTVLASNKVNIASINLGRERSTGRAVSLVGVDSPVGAEVLSRLSSRPGIESVRTVSFGEPTRPA
jgi:D-3-phosphoglycerate dehydrogenase